MILSQSSGMLCYGQDVLMFNHIAMLAAINKAQSDMTASVAVRVKGTKSKQTKISYILLLKIV